MVWEGKMYLFLGNDKGEDGLVEVLEGQVYLLGRLC